MHINITLTLNDDQEIESAIVGKVILYLSSLEHTWSDDYPSVKLEKPFTKFYGGSGEGRAYDDLGKALCASLYDEYQVNDLWEDGDTFTLTHEGKTYDYICQGVHVVQVETP